MTQTPSRDWQKDMDDVRHYLKDRHSYHHAEQTLRGTPVADILQYWLQEAKVYKQSYEGTLTAWEAEKARADAAEAREQKLIDIMHIIAFESDDERTQKYALLMLSNLYPDTPAPKEGTNEA